VGFLKYCSNKAAQQLNQQCRTQRMHDMTANGSFASIYMLLMAALTAAAAAAAVAGTTSRHLATSRGTLASINHGT
jgi:hypothetical protein